MLKTLLHHSTRQFEQRYAYDASYLHRLIDTSLGAGLRSALLPLLSQYRGPKTGQAIWAGAALASVLEGDCGPCAQLVIDLGLEAGIDGAQLAACTREDWEAAGDVGFGFRFGRAAIADEVAAQSLGEIIEQRFGVETRAAACFAAATSRAYPVLKRGLGHGAPCQIDGLRFAAPKALPA